MPSNATRLRIDWTPGSAAAAALAIGEELLPHLGRQAVIDKLLITGLHALRHAPPVLWGSDRDTWELPRELAMPMIVPGNATSAPGEPDAKFPGSLREHSDSGQPARRHNRSKP